MWGSFYIIPNRIHTYIYIIIYTYIYNYIYICIYVYMIYNNNDKPLVGFYWGYLWKMTNLWYTAIGIASGSWNMLIAATWYRRGRPGEERPPRYLESDIKARWNFDGLEHGLRNFHFIYDNPSHSRMFFNMVRSTNHLMMMMMVVLVVGDLTIWVERPCSHMLNVWEAMCHKARTPLVRKLKRLADDSIVDIHCSGTLHERHRLRGCSFV